MKTKYWIALIAFVLVVCAGLSIWLLWPGEEAAYAEIWSDGKLLHTLALSVDCEVTVQTSRGTNVVTVKDGKIAVTEADCPDHYCMDRGFCAGGTQIVCLPNRLVIRFASQQEMDGVVG